jgi:hypothetical protein
MPVLVEVFSVITRRSRIEECYPGGVDGFFRDCPNRTACADEHLVRVGFMDPESVRDFVERLQTTGLVYRDDQGQAMDLVVATQGKGPAIPCDWAEFFLVNLSGANVEICRMAGTDSHRLACPAWWRPKKAAQTSLIHVQSDDEDSRMEVLREENGMIVARDRVTGKTMYSPSSRPRQVVSNTLEMGRPISANKKSWWGALLALLGGD